METECFNYIYHIWSMLRWHNLLIDQTLDLLVEDYRIRNNDEVREIFGKNRPRQSIHQTNDIWHPFSTKRMIEKARNKSKSKIVSDHLNANVLEQENIKYRDNLIRHDILEIESYSSNVVGVLNGRFLSFEMDSPVLKVGFTDLEDFEIEENQVNLKLELHLPNMPEELFSIQYDAENEIVILKNMTSTSQGDFGIFVTADDDVQCLLDADMIELKDKSLITFEELNFMFYRNPNYEFQPEQPSITPLIFEQMPLEENLELTPNDMLDSGFYVDEHIHDPQLNSPSDSSEPEQTSFPVRAYSPSAGMIPKSGITVEQSPTTSIEN